MHLLAQSRGQILESICSSSSQWLSGHVLKSAEHAEYKFVGLVTVRGSSLQEQKPVTEPFPQFEMHSFFELW